MIQKLFMSCEYNTEHTAKFGPFKTAEEAEAHTLKLGWDWVLVVARTVDESGRVLGVKNRFYQPGTVQKQKAPVVVAPLSKSETDFFAVYERQMSTPVTK